MNETAFKQKLINTFESAGNSKAFIWKHESKFKSGFPDLYWRTPAFINGNHWELKSCRSLKRPTDIMNLATKLQLKILSKLAASGARAALVVLHTPPTGQKTITVASFNKWTVKVWKYEDFMRWWGNVPHMTYFTE